MRATRAQADRVLYKAAIRRRLENQPNLWLFQQARTTSPWWATGSPASSPRSACASRRRGGAHRRHLPQRLIHVGMQNYSAGRAGDPPAISLGQRLKELALPQGRLKTGTPPRLDARTIDFSVMEEQPGDDPVPVFSFLGQASQHPRQLPCWITSTNSRTHDIIRANLDRSPMYAGVIEGVGPRYRPSIEDKIHRFADKDSHHVFLEPEGPRHPRDLPQRDLHQPAFDVQLDIVRSIKGPRTATSCAPATPSSTTTSGPAQAQVQPRDQGPSAGCSSPARSTAPPATKKPPPRACWPASTPRCRCRAASPWCPRRDEAYLGVLVDDLITRGVSEPYRMFHSRAEYRLSLREDNADLRLTEKPAAPRPEWTTNAGPPSAPSAKPSSAKPPACAPPGQPGQASRRRRGSRARQEHRARIQLLRPAAPPQRELRQPDDPCPAP